MLKAQPTKKQSEVMNNRIIKAVEALGPTAKTSEIFQFLQEKRQGPYLAKTVLQCRLSRLKSAGRVSLQNGCRNADEMEEWRSSIADIVRGQGRQLGVRGVFYLAVAAGLCEKNERAYSRISVALDTLRMSGEVDFSSIIDPGRTIHPYGLDRRSPVLDLVTSAADYDEIQTYIESRVEREADEEPCILEPTPPMYSQAREPYELTGALINADEVVAQIDHGPWDGCEEVPFVICEKEGLSGVIEPICNQYAVPFVAVRGAASITILRDMWELLQTGELPWRLLTFYDFDKAGVDIENAALNRLMEFGGAAEWTHQRIAVTPDQIEQLDLPMRPEKQGAGEAVELDAIPPDTLAEIVEEAIKSCIPGDIEERRTAAHSEAQVAHRAKVYAMVDTLMEDYEPERNAEMEIYVEEAQPQFDDLIEQFLSDAPA